MMFSRDPVVLKFIKKISVHNDEVAARKVIQEAFFILKTKYGVAEYVLITSHFRSILCLLLRV